MPKEDGAKYSTVHGRPLLEKVDKRIPARTARKVKSGQRKRETLFAGYIVLMIDDTAPRN